MKERNITQTLSKNGYVNAVICSKCGIPLGFIDEDIIYKEQELGEDEKELFGYITCPFCGIEVLVGIDVIDTIRRYNIAKYYGMIKNNKFAEQGKDGNVEK